MSGIQISIDKMCRACLESLDSSTVTYDLFLEPNLAKKLAVCTLLTVEPQDNFPKNICNSCYNKLNDLHEFQKLCVNSVQRFREILSNITEIGTTIDDVLSQEKDDQVPYDPLLNHKTELIENEEEVFKMLEHVVKEAEEVEKKLNLDNNLISFSESSSTEEDLPLAQRLRCREINSKSNLIKGKRHHHHALLEQRLLPTNLVCHICKQKFKKQLNYDDHMKHHNDLLPYQCTAENCKKGFTTSAALRLHVDYAHTKNEYAAIPCTVEGCKLQFPRIRLLTIHLRKVHNLTRSVAPRLERSCSECGMTFRCPVALKKHMYKHTGQDLPFPCNICGKGFHISSALKNHLLRHAGIKNYVCPYCGVGKTTRQEWSKHILTHTQEKMFKCQLCDHATHTSRSLENHIKIVHEKIKNYACQYCGKTFGKSHACKIHEMTHTGEKRCECKVCGKKFLYTESLTKHLKIHEKSFVRTTAAQETTVLDRNVINASDQLLKACAESVATIPRDPRRVERVDINKLAGTIINPISSVPSVLAAAAVAVTAVGAEGPKETLHFCPGCNQSFNNLGNMRRHFKSVHEKVKDFECRFCSRRFANSQSMKQHEWIHTGEKPYCCKVCGSNFRQEAALIRHQKVHNEKLKKSNRPRPSQQTSERDRKKELTKLERKYLIEGRRTQIAVAAKKQLEHLANQRNFEKESNTYEEYESETTKTSTEGRVS